MLKTSYDLNIAFDKMTEEIDEVIGREVHKFNNKLHQKARDVWLTGNFFRSFKEPVKDGYNWTITNTADYSPVLARGRRTINGVKYGSKKWAGGINPMLDKLEADIIKHTDAIKV